MSKENKDSKTVTEPVPSLIYKTFKYDLAMTKEQDEFFTKTLGAGRYYYNQALNEINQLVKAKKAHLADGEKAKAKEIRIPSSYHAFCSYFNSQWRKEKAPWAQNLPCGAYLRAFEALGSAFQNYHQNPQTVGYPRFKKKGKDSESILFRKPKLTDNKHIQLVKPLGEIESKESFKKLNRILKTDDHARILRSVLVKRTNKWSLSIALELSKTISPPRHSQTVIGVDLGINQLLSLSTGEFIFNPRYYENALLRMNRLSKKYSRKLKMNNPHKYNGKGALIKGSNTPWIKSNNLLKLERRINTLNEKIKNQRKDYTHKLTTQLIQDYGLIGVEDLNVSGLIKSKQLSKQISDASWGMVLNQLKYKAEWNNRQLIQVGRFYPSSKTCSSCGSVKAKLNRGEREYKCDNKECNLIIDRDYNAALNIEDEALRLLHENNEHNSTSTCGASIKARGGTVRLIDTGSNSVKTANSSEPRRLLNCKNGYNQRVNFKEQSLGCH